MGGGGGTPLLLLEFDRLLSKLLLRFFNSLNTFVKLLCTLLLFEGEGLFASVALDDFFESAAFLSTLTFLTAYSTLVFLTISEFFRGGLWDR